MTYQANRRPLGCVLAMRVMQSDLYRQLDEAERADCDELVRQNLEWFKADAALPPQAKAEPAGVSEREAFEAWFEPDEHNRKSLQAWRDGDDYRADSWYLSGCWNGWKARAILSAAPSAGVIDITAALSSPGVERLRDFYAVGPVQRAAVECFVDALGVGGPLKGGN